MKKQGEYDRLDDIMGFSLGKTYNVVVEEGASVASGHSLLNNSGKVDSLPADSKTSYESYRNNDGTIKQARQLQRDETINGQPTTKGSWIIIEDKGKQKVITNEQFKETFKKL